MIDKSQPRRWTRHGLVISTAVLALGAAACGGSAEPDPGTAKDSQQSTSADGPAALLPDDVREAGEITVAGDASYPPIGMMADDGVTMEGLDSELADALGEVLGVTFNHQNTSFDSIIPGLQGDKFQLGMSWMNDTEERRAVVDFIDYSKDGSSILVRADGPHPESLEELCGLKVAVQKGTAQQEDATNQSKACEDAGNDAVSVLTYPDQTAANLALTSGRADLTIADTPVAVWQVDQTGGELEISGEPYGAVYHGIAALKGSDVVPAVAAAMQELMDNGTYGEILSKWGMDDAAIDEVLVNGEPLS